MAATTSSILISIVFILFTFLGDNALRSAQNWSPIIWFNPFYVLQVIAHHLPDLASVQPSFQIPVSGTIVMSPPMTYDWDAILASVIVEMGFIIGSLFCMTRHYRLRTER